jgi:hypothetical protein
MLKTQISSEEAASYFRSLFEAHESAGKKRHSRISKAIYGVTTGYLYDGSNVVQELSGTTPSANLLSGGQDEVFTRTDSSGVADFLRDGIGNTAELTAPTKPMVRG